MMYKNFPYIFFCKIMKQANGSIYFGFKYNPVYDFKMMHTQMYIYIYIYIYTVLL
jgi:hypothetical protein